jgi:hypothetical protein
MKKAHAPRGGMRFGSNRGVQGFGMRMRLIISEPEMA